MTRKNRFPVWTNRERAHSGARFLALAAAGVVVLLGAAPNAMAERLGGFGLAFNDFARFNVVLTNNLNQDTRDCLVTLEFVDAEGKLLVDPRGYAASASFRLKPGVAEFLEIRGADFVEDTRRHVRPVLTKKGDCDCLVRTVEFGDTADGKTKGLLVPPHPNHCGPGMFGLARTQFAVLNAVLLTNGNASDNDANDEGDCLATLAFVDNVGELIVGKKVTLRPGVRAYIELSSAALENCDLRTPLIRPVVSVETDRGACDGLVLVTVELIETADHKTRMVYQITPPHPFLPPNPVLPGR